MSMLSDEEKSRAIQLARHRKCPHCNKTISLRDAISMVRGDGVERVVQVRLEDGRGILIEANAVNPQTMRVLGD
jgi:hypothetical protein